MPADPARRPRGSTDPEVGFLRLDEAMVRRELAALHEALRGREDGLRVPLDVDLPDERDTLSVRLVEVLRETRDRRALSLLYRLNAPVLERFVRRRLGDLTEVEASDVVDETFLRVLRRCETFRSSETATFCGWAMVIAENVIRQLRRSRRRSGAVAWPDDGWTPVDPAPPADPLEEDELRTLVAESWPTLVRLSAAALLRLPPRWRRVLELREGEGLSYREVAVRMGIRTGYVAMLLHRARARVLRSVTAALAPYREPRR
ncbi:MAG: RNA polymerase sigma factor [Planctomycetota bacterium JB042]